MVNIKKEVQAKTRAIEQIRRFMSFSFVFLMSYGLTLIIIYMLIVVDMQNKVKGSVGVIKKGFKLLDYGV